MFGKLHEYRRARRKAMGVPLDKEHGGQYLLLGLLTDSGNFSHDDVTEETFLTAAKLVKAGADIRLAQL